MITQTSTIERPKALGRALHRITEVLAAELSQPTADAPDWSGFEWTVACAAAGMHGVSPLLAHTSRWRGPPQWMQFLQQQRDHTVRRHARIEHLLQRLDHCAAAAGIAALAMKGAALHAIGVYSAGERPMADIDLLVRPENVTRASAMLESIGYRAFRSNWKETGFAPVDSRRPGALGENADNDITIELHERVCEKLPLRMTDISEYLFCDRPRAGVNPYPSQSSLMLHLLLHAAGEMAFQSLRLVHLHDIAKLSERLTAAEWNAVVRSRVNGESPWWAFPPLRLTALYYRASVPDALLQALGDQCSALLWCVSRRKNLSDVSFSHLWVDAFPGIEWCRSLPEAVRYGASRVRPSREHMRLRQIVADTQPWAAGSPWSTLPQGRRIMRWLRGRPMRAVTLDAVQASIAYVQRQQRAHTTA